jgi:signal transduction histidine kinase
MSISDAGRGMLDAPVLQPKRRNVGYNLGHSTGRALLALMWGVLVLPSVPDSSWTGLAFSFALLSVVGDGIRFGVVTLTILVSSATSTDELSRALVGGIVLAAGNILADVLRNEGYEGFRSVPAVPGFRRVLRLRLPFWNRWCDVGLLAACGLWMSFAAQRWEGTRVLLPQDGDAVLALVFGVFITAASVRAARAYAQAVTEKETQAAAAVAAERARIARELHDVVAHRLSGVVVQSQVAQLATGAEASQVLATIERESRAALDELRSLLGALRADAYVPRLGDDSTVEPPQERLDDATLTRIVSDPPAGIREIEAEVDGDLDRLPSAVALQALRVVQESLTNAARHAPGAAIRIEVTLGDGHLRASVANGPGGPSAGGGTGIGLVGLRERATLVGGTLETGPTPDGGWRVELRCPVPV